MDFTGDIVISEYYADQTDISYKVNGSWADVTNNSINCTGSITFVGDVGLDSAGGNKRNVTWYAPKIYMNTNNGEYGIWLRNDENNSITYYNSSVNFDNAKWDIDPDYIGRIFFTGTSSLNITANSIGKTLIKASTLAGTITLDVEDGVQDGDTFLVQATDNQLVITDGEWTATPSTVGNITTYTLSKVAPVYKTRLIYEHLTDIPLNFTEVEFIQSTGTQYIDTGYIASNKSGFKIDIMPLQATDKYFIGSRPRLNSDDRFLAGSNAGPQVYVGWNTNTFVNWTLNNVHTVQNNFMNSRTKVLDGTTIAQITSDLSSQGTRTVYLFSANDANAVSMDTCRIYKVQISEGSVLVRDFVPCLDNNNVPCMYDKVEGKAYYNSGTGTFSYGRKIIPVEYLESSGTQYIDTNYAANLNTIVEYNFNLVEVPTSSAFFGSGTSSTSTDRFQGYYESSLSFSTKLASTTTYSGITLTAGTKHYSKMGIPLAGYYIDDTFIASATGTPTSLNLYVFARNINGSMQVPIKMKLYDFKISENNSLVRDFIPCKDENNVGFMFDRVTHTAYLNAGTGSFTVGKVMPKKKLRLIRDSKRRVPKGFKEVEYLQSSGTQYIDTGYEMSAGKTMAFNGNIMWTQSNGIANFFYGYRSVNSAEYRGDMRAFFVYGPSGGGSTGRLAIRYGVNTDNSTSTILQNQKYNISFDGTNLKVDGTTFINLSDAYTPAVYQNMYLFWCNCTGYYSADVAKFSGRIYNWQIFEDGVLVRDFIPCLDNNNVPCMYDLVEGKAYYNVGTGSFTYGHTITPVEYLQSTGTQYIDTGIFGKSGLVVKTKVNYTYLSGTGSHAIGGEYTSATSCYLGMVRASGNFTYLYKGTVVETNTKIITDTDYALEITLNNGSQVYKLNGGVISSLSVSGDFNSNKNLYLYAINSVNGADVYGSLKMYYLQIYDGGVLVRDFIPVKDENNVGYMLDKVSHTLYSNAGTGAFVVGGEYKDIVRFLKGE